MHYAHDDVNTVHLPTPPGASDCHRVLSGERSSPWISLSLLPLEDSPLVPIINIEVKQGFQLLVTHV